MTRNAKKRPAPCKGRASNANTAEHSTCACERQQIPITRKEFFAGMALQGLLAATSNPQEAFELCGANGPATASTCFIIAARMEVAARAEIGCGL